MAYETKVILIAISEIMKSSQSLSEAHQKLAKMANAEGVVLEPLDERHGG
ncbi:MAG: hypothetical protein FWE20_00380 [Defluviitaleaceae bacterium]|nr:hypothetical protein [Defluviitaleaceae bacterium]